MEDKDIFWVLLLSLLGGVLGAELFMLLLDLMGAIKVCENIQLHC
jgi:hypothetical protein